MWINSFVMHILLSIHAKEFKNKLQKIKSSGLSINFNTFLKVSIEMGDPRVYDSLLSKSKIHSYFLSKIYESRKDLKKAW
jgi:hypothetical protein